MNIVDTVYMEIMEKANERIRSLSSAIVSANSEKLNHEGNDFHCLYHDDTFLVGNSKRELEAKVLLLIYQKEKERFDGNTKI